MYRFYAVLAIALFVAGCGQFRTSTLSKLVERSEVSEGLPTPAPTLTPMPAPAPSALSVKDLGVGIDRVVTIESNRRFRLVFEAADNWGLAQWYDLVHDPEGKTNLADETGFSLQPGLFQIAFYGGNPDDVRLYTRVAKLQFPNVPRSFKIIESSSSKIVVEAVSSPMDGGEGVMSDIVATVRYHIYPDGKLYIGSRIDASGTQTFKDFRHAVLGLNDPTYNAEIPPDSSGWIRCSPSQSPYTYVQSVEKYIYAYWSPNTPEPYRNFSKASIMLVPRPGNVATEEQWYHGWLGFKRWFYRAYNFTIAANTSVTQEYLIQLGTQNDSLLPDLNRREVTDPIAEAYRTNPIPP